MKKTLIIGTLSIMLLLLSCGNKTEESKTKAASVTQEAEWISWFNGKDLSGRRISRQRWYGAYLRRTGTE